MKIRTVLGEKLLYDQHGFINLYIKSAFIISPQVIYVGENVLNIYVKTWNTY
jgi:hypothetical protein